MGTCFAATVGLGAQAQTAAPQSAGNVIAQIRSLDRFEAEQERLRELTRNQPAAYQDRFLQSDEAPAPAQQGPDGASEPEGMRFWLAEAQGVWSRRSQSGLPTQRSIESGLRLQVQQETLNHGEWVLQADTRRLGGASGASTAHFSTVQPTGSRLTLRTLGLPLTPNAFADLSAGDIGSDITDGLSRSLRLTLGSSTVQGIAARVFAQDTDVRIGWGQRGQMSGGPYAGFERTSGDVAWAGLTRRSDEKRYAAVQINRLSGARPEAGTGTTAPTDSTGLAATVGQGYLVVDDGDHRSRLTLVSSTSRVDGLRDTSHGLFVEGAVQMGAHRHEAGFFATRPRLRFGDQLVADGSRGMYWRMDVGSPRFHWGVGADHERQASRNGEGPGGIHTTGISANWQHRIDRRSSWGGYLQLSQQQANGGLDGQRSAFASAAYQHRWQDWGDSQLRATLRRNQSLVTNGPRATGEELEWEQQWLRQTSDADTTSLSTSLGWARDRSDGSTDTYPTAGMNLRMLTSSNHDLALSLRYTSRTGNLSTSRGLSGALQTEGPLAPGWRVGASLLINQAVVSVDNNAVLPGMVNVSRSADRTAHVYVRYEGQRGRPFAATAGAAQGAGAGRIGGVVFLDANRDGMQQVNEEGVPGVEVLLNGRERALTDSRGRYVFPQVRTGSQRLSLRPESIPLPWGEGPQSRTTVDVPLRGEAIAPLGVVRSVN